MSEPIEDRRRFQRIATDKKVVVNDSVNLHEGIVLDVSLRGLLFQAQDDWLPAEGVAVHARIELDGELSRIDIDGTVAHVDSHRIGIRTTGMDLESATRLRRMVELNLADENLMERDLAELLRD